MNHHITHTHTMVLRFMIARDEGKEKAGVESHLARTFSAGVYCFAV